MTIKDVAVSLRYRCILSTSLNNSRYVSEVEGFYLLLVFFKTFSVILKPKNWKMMI